MSLLWKLHYLFCHISFLSHIQSNLDLHLSVQQLSAEKKTNSRRDFYLLRISISPELHQEYCCQTAQPHMGLFSVVFPLKAPAKSCYIFLITYSYVALNCITTNVVLHTHAGACNSSVCIRIPETKMFCLT